MKKKVIAIVVTACVVVVAATIGIVFHNKNSQPSADTDSNGSHSNNTLSDILDRWNNADYDYAEDAGDYNNLSDTNYVNNLFEDGVITSQGDYIYISNDKTIIEYDINTGVAIDLEVELMMVSRLRATEDYVYYHQGRSGTWFRFAKDDGKIEKVDLDGYTPEGYNDGKEAFYCMSPESTEGHLGTHLYRHDLVTGEKTLLVENVRRTFVDEKNVYAICYVGEDFYETVLMKASRKTLQFEQVPLSFSPDLVFASKDDVYLLERTQNYMAAKIVRVSNGVETELPMMSESYQVYGNKLVYKTRIGNRLEIYDIETGETTSICDKMTTGLYVLHGRYVCYTTYEKAWYKLYDLETGETKLIYGEE